VGHAKGRTCFLFFRPSSLVIRPYVPHANFLQESLQAITPICATLIIEQEETRLEPESFGPFCFSAPFRSTISVKTGSCENLFAKQAPHRAQETASIQNKAVTRRGTKEKSLRECKKIFSNQRLLFI
jgi:hypothetical protein